MNQCHYTIFTTLCCHCPFSHHLITHNFCAVVVANAGGKHPAICSATKSCRSLVRNDSHPTGSSCVALASSSL